MKFELVIIYLPGLYAFASLFIKLRYVKYLTSKAKVDIAAAGLASRANESTGSLKEKDYYLRSTLEEQKVM